MLLSACFTESCASDMGIGLKGEVAYLCAVLFVVVEVDDAANGFLSCFCVTLGSSTLRILADFVRKVPEGGLKALSQIIKIIAYDNI